jgi:hypothetical protein
MHITLHVKPRTKKNSQIPIPIGKRIILLPSAAYKKYLAECRDELRSILPTMEGCSFPLSGYYNCACVYYMDARRIVDLSNLNSALHDMLQDCGVIVNDDCMHIGSSDGSFVQYDKDNPRLEITLTDCTYPKAWEERKK